VDPDDAELRHQTATAAAAEQAAGSTKFRLTQLRWEQLKP
jgi:hypothetical protein